MTAYASGTCDPLPWKLTSKHRGGVSKSFTLPSLREHYVSMDKEKAGGGKNFRRQWGENRQCWDVLTSSFFDNDDMYRMLTWYLMLG